LFYVARSCPVGYRIRFPYCLKVSADKRGYYSAKQACINEGATLAYSRNSLEMENDITNYFQNYVGQGYFWTDGNAPRLSCVARAVGIATAVGFFNRWEGRPCNDRYHYMCMTWTTEVKPFRYSSPSNSQRSGDFFPVPGQAQYFRARYQHLQRPTTYVFQFFSGKSTMHKV